MSDVVLDPLEAAPFDATARTDAVYPLGVSLPPLEVADLPLPEQVFGVERLGRRETWRYAFGPSLIGLGAAIGSGEWILGPLTIGASGFAGIGWLITVAVLLQCVALVEIGRYVTATGESPIVGFARVPPGRRLWVPLALFAVLLPTFSPATLPWTREPLPTAPPSRPSPPACSAPSTAGGCST